MARIRTMAAAVLLAAGLTLGSVAVAEAAPAADCTLQGKAQMLCKDPSKGPQPGAGQKGPDGVDLVLCATGLRREKPHFSWKKGWRVLGGPLGGATACLIDLGRD